MSTVIWLKMYCTKNIYYTCIYRNTFPCNLYEASKNSNFEIKKIQMFYKAYTYTVRSLQKL